MNKIILKILCWINGIKNPFVWAYKQEIKEKRKMTAEEYRQKIIQAFHNADCDELIAICVLPTEKEFEHLEWLLKNHYKKEPCDKYINEIDHLRKYISKLETQIVEQESCEDCISRQAVLDLPRIKTHNMWGNVIKESVDVEDVKQLPSVEQEPKTGHWIYTEYHIWCCSECGGNPHKGTGFTPNKDGMKMRWKYCNLCGARMVEQKESKG